MEETILLKVLSLIHVECPIEVYDLSAPGKSSTDRTLVMSGNSNTIDADLLSGYELYKFYVSNETLIFEVYEDSSELEDDLTLRDILGYMYPQDRAIVVYHESKSRPLTTIHSGYVPALINALCTDDAKADAHVVRSICVSNAFVGENFDEEQIVTIELYEPREVSDCL